jgi:hypothetical protein
MWIVTWSIWSSFYCQPITADVIKIIVSEVQDGGQLINLGLNISNELVGRSILHCDIFKK